MANKFREIAPIRTCGKVYANYRDFKSYLQDDFNKRCGYTDCSDFWFGGMGCFHIDHFKAWKRYPHLPNLKTDYSNLVYCCSYVNILKSDDDDANYIDPCNEDFNDHFNRTINGAIVAKQDSERAKYMFKRLKLYLTRYQIIWTVDNLKNKMKILKDLIQTETDPKLKVQLQIAQSELASLMVEHLDYLGANQ